VTELPRMLQADVLAAYPEPEFLRPWRVIVTCKLMNLCTADQARGVVYNLFGAWDHPARLASAGEGLEELLRPLGMKSVRAAALRQMSYDFQRGVPAERCFGVGQYAVESLRIFIGGDLNFEPDDVKLRAYVRAAKAVKSAALPTECCGGDEDDCIWGIANCPKERS